MKGPMARLARRVDNMVARAVVWMVDNTKKLQEVQVSLQTDEIRTAQRMQQYGFSGVPLAGAHATVLFVGGLRDNAICLAVDDPAYRPTTDQPGDVRVYNSLGDHVLLRIDGTIEVVATAKVEVTAPEVVVHASTKVTLDTPLCEMSGDLTVAGQVQGTTVRTAAGIQLGTHVHSGVQAGGANTGAPV